MPADLIPILVSGGFLTTGVYCWIKRLPLATTAFFVNGAGTLAAGVLSGTGSPLGAQTFYLHLALLAPLALHFHLLLQGRALRPLERNTLIGLYLTAFIAGGLFFAGANWPSLFNTFTSARLFIRVAFMLAICLTLAFLVYSYKHFSNLSSRRHIRLISLSTAYALAPIILLTMLPQTVGSIFISESYTIPWLLLIPIIFSYSLFRARLGHAEGNFRMMLSYYVVLTVLLSFYFFANRVLDSILVAGGITSDLLAFSIPLVLFSPVRKQAVRFVDWTFYGDEGDYSVALSYLDMALSRVLERDKITRLLLVDLVAAVKPVSAVLFLNDREGMLSFAGSRNAVDPALASVCLPPGALLCRMLASNSAPVEAEVIRKKIGAAAGLLADEKRMLAAANVALWLPFQSDARLYGLMLISFRAGDDLFTEEDKRLLSIITGKVGLAIRNVTLAERFQKGQEELEKAHNMVVESQEQERRRIALELHDDTIQQLIGISYELSDFRKKYGGSGSSALPDELETVRQDILRVVAQVRDLIGELRPMGLDDLGLPAAIEEYARQVEKMGGEQGPKIDVFISGEVSFLPEIHSITLFRVAQEALRNAVKHSAATTIFLRLHREEHEVVLEVHDDGCGFEVPARLNELTNENHFGLIGMTERAAHIGGRVDIESTLNEGTSIIMAIPIE